MEKILLSENTRQHLDDVIKNAAHGLLLIGAKGAGKSYLAKVIASRLLGLPSALIDAHIHVINTNKKAIGIEAIRQLQQFLYLKTVGTAKVRRVVIIEDSDLMTTEAQNALLKMLEEPPSDTVLLLTTSQSALLKPTILSRVQRLHIHPASKKDSIIYFENQGYKTADISKVYLLANGQPGLMHALLSGDDHPLAIQIEQAKRLFAMSSYERLLAIENISKNREEIPELLYACKRISSSALEAAVEKSTEQATAWLKRKKSIIEAEQRMLYTPNTKLLLTDLFLNL